MQKLDAYRPVALGLLRIALGLVMINFGLAKIAHFEAGQFMPPVGSLPWFGGLIELVVGAFFLIGYQTRIAAFILSGEMAVAYFVAHLPVSFFPTINGGFAAAIYAFVFLYFVTAGAGRFSVDAAIEK